MTKLLSANQPSPGTDFKVQEVVVVVEEEEANGDQEGIVVETGKDHKEVKGIMVTRVVDGVVSRQWVPMEIREDMASKLVIPGVLATEADMVVRRIQDMVVGMDNRHMGTSTMHRATMVPVRPTVVVMEEVMEHLHPNRLDNMVHRELPEDTIKGVMELDTPILTAINSPLLLTQDRTLTVLEDQCQHLMVSEWETTHSSTTHTVDELTHHDLLLFNFSLLL